LDADAVAAVDFLYIIGLSLRTKRPSTAVQRGTSDRAS
jgi:hypothetical protein